MIELQNVTKYYVTKSGRHYVLRDASLVIQPLEKIGVLGRNGAGKSTLMRLFAGVDIPNAGTIKRSGSISWPMGLATGIQSPLTGRENAKFACRIQGLHGNELKEAMKFIQEFSELKKYFEMPVRTYSAGMKARLNFAVAMAFDFDFYIIDELTAVGDQAFRKKSKDVFNEKRQKCGFIKVSHNLNELKAECDTALLLSDGKLERYEDVGEAIEIYQTSLQAGAKGNPKAPPKPATKDAAPQVVENKPPMRPNNQPHQPAPMMPRRRAS